MFSLSRISRNHIEIRLNNDCIIYFIGIENAKKLRSNSIAILVGFVSGIVIRVQCESGFMSDSCLGSYLG